LKDITITEVLKSITSEDEFMDKLQCQDEFLNSIEIDKPSSYILASIARGDPLLKVLRLICIHCFVNNGFKQTLLENYKREFIRSYGLKYFNLMQCLEKVGFIYLQGQNVKLYNTLKQKLNLFVNDVNEDNPNDISYVFCGYAPLSVRFCQYLNRPNWRAYADVFGNLPGPFFEETQKLPNGIRKRSKIHSFI
jgi:vacuolar protein sorting-associated protein 33A